MTAPTVQELDDCFAAVNQALQARMQRLTDETQLTIAGFLDGVGKIAREYRDDTTTSE